MMYYRAEAWSLTNADHVTYYEYSVIRKTPHGVVIQDGGGTRRIAENIGGRITIKRWAWPTKVEALESLYQRKLKQIGILSSRLEWAQKEMKDVEAERRDPSWAIRLLPAPECTKEQTLIPVR
jgi:hypothetical protein